MRVSTLALALVLAACADSAPTPAPEASTPTDVAVQPPTTLDPTPADTASGTVEAPGVIDAPTASVPPEPEPRTEPTPAPPVSDALLPRPRPMPPAVPIEDPVEAPADDAARTEAAEAFWASFRAAIRAGDAAGMRAGLADVVTVGEVEYRRDSPQVQSVVEQIVENAHVRDAYVAAERLMHGPDESAFSSVARVETPEGDVTEARISGAVREVTPGDWRLVRLRTDPVEA